MKGIIPVSLLCQPDNFISPGEHPGTVLQWIIGDSKIPEFHITEQLVVLAVEHISEKLLPREFPMVHNKDLFCCINILKIQKCLFKRCYLSRGIISAGSPIVTFTFNYDRSIIGYEVEPVKFSRANIDRIFLKLFFEIGPGKVTYPLFKLVRINIGRVSRTGCLMDMRRRGLIIGHSINNEVFLAHFAYPPLTTKNPLIRKFSADTVDLLMQVYAGKVLEAPVTTGFTLFPYRIKNNLTI
jgi:hypothetical protein